MLRVRHPITVFMKELSKLHGDCQSVSQSVCLVVEHPLGLKTRKLLLIDSYCLVYVERPL
jgi:hypothetical protein